MKQFRADSAVVVIDMQNGFLERESPLCIQGAKETVPACSRVIRQAHREQVPVFFVNRRYRADGSDVELVRKERWEQGGRPLSELAGGPLSAENPPELGGGPQDYMLVKPRFSAFSIRSWIFCCAESRSRRFICWELRRRTVFARRVMTDSHWIMKW